nr:MAG TPA: endopeptidase tail [Caudoviricetes sp.]
MSYKIYAGTQSGVDKWVTKACIYDPGDITDTKKLISPTLTREVGKAGSLEFTLPLGNVAHSALQKLMTVVEVQQDGKQIWQGRVMSHEQDFLVRQKVYCEGEMAYLNDSGTAPYSARNVSFSQFLEWVCANHNAQVDAFKAFTPGKVQMDTPMVVPYIDGLKVEKSGHHYDDDNYYIQHYAIYNPINGTVLWSEEVQQYQSEMKASCLSWTLNAERMQNGYVLSRIGDNNFRMRLPVAYADGKTWDASVSVANAYVSCPICNKDFGTYSIYDITKGTESSTYNITEKGGSYSLAINGKVDIRFAFDTKEPTYSFGDGKNYGKTLDILQSELTDKYGGYFVIRHGSVKLPVFGQQNYRYLDYMQKITDKNPQTIAFGVNMLDLTSYTKAEDICTRVIAFGTKTEKTWPFVDIQSIISQTADDVKAQKIYGIITKVIQVEGNYNNNQSLLDAAEEELAKNLRYLNGMTVKAVDLKDAGIDIDRLAIGKQTHIFSAAHGVDTWLLCSKLVEPLDAPDKKEFTFGTEFSSLSDLQSLTARKASDAYDLSRALKG